MQREQFDSGCVLLGGYTYVGGALARGIARVGLELELHALTFLQVVEDTAGNCGGVEEDVFVGVIGLDESKPPVSNKTDDLASSQC
jgi:hypothetical protein